MRFVYLTLVNTNLHTSIKKLIESILFDFQGGREVSDFISYLKREATNTVVVQDEEKPKKKKSEL